jgi:MFS family permease
MPILFDAAHSARSTLRSGFSRGRRDLDEFMAGPAARTDEGSLTARQGRRLLWLDGLISSVSEAFVTSFVHPFALSLGATNGQIGMLSSLTSMAAAIGLLPGARLGDQVKIRKRVVMLAGGGAGRLILFAVAAAPLLLPPPIAVYVYILLIAGRGFIGQLGYPAWLGVMADLAPAAIRGRYFSGRNIAMALAGLLFAPLAGRLIDLIGPPAGYQISFLLAGIIGLAATAVFSRIPEPPPPPIEEAVEPAGHGLFGFLRQHPRFTAFAAVAFIWNLAINVAGPFFTVHLVRNLGATPTEIGILATIQSLSTIVGQRVWGRLHDRKGALWIVRFSGFMIPCLPLLWAIAPAPWFVGLIYTVGGFAWAGHGLANFNLLLSLTPAVQRGRYVAAYQIAAFAGAALGPLIGGALLDLFAIRTLFLVSACGRLTATVVFLLTVRGETEK